MALSAEDLPRAINPQTLNSVVGKLRGNTGFEILAWQVEPLTGGSTTAGVFRLSGAAQAQGQNVNWSLVLKLIPSPAQDREGMLMTSDDPANSTYWKREYLVYALGLLDDLPTGFAAPRCLLAEEKDGICWLWLEDLGALDGHRWTLEDFRVAARHLGMFNGVWLAQRKLPAHSWLHHTMVRERAYRSATNQAQFSRAAEALRRDTRLDAVWTDAHIADSWQILAEREQLLAALTRLPQTLLHQDAGRKNLHIHTRAGGERVTIAIDWGFAGIGAVGADLACLVVATARWFGLEPGQIPEVEAQAFEPYLEGLSAVGWQGEPETVRLGYLLASALLFSPIWVGVTLDLSSAMQARIAEAFGRPYDEVIFTLSQVNRYVVAHAREARALLNT